MVTVLNRCVVGQLQTFGGGKRGATGGKKPGRGRGREGVHDGKRKRRWQGSEVQWRGEREDGDDGVVRGWGENGKR